MTRLGTEEAYVLVDDEGRFCAAYCTAADIETHVHKLDDVLLIFIRGQQFIVRRHKADG